MHLTHAKELEIATRVLARSSAARDWARNTLKAYDLNPDSAEYVQKVDELALRYARRMLKGA